MPTAEQAKRRKVASLYRRRIYFAENKGLVISCQGNYIPTLGIKSIDYFKKWLNINYHVKQNRERIGMRPVLVQ